MNTVMAVLKLGNNALHSVSCKSRTGVEYREYDLIISHVVDECCRLNPHVQVQKEFGKSVSLFTLIFTLKVDNCIKVHLSGVSIEEEVGGPDLPYA